jgi:hypothetical protein
LFIARNSKGRIENNGNEKGCKEGYEEGRQEKEVSWLSSLNDHGGRIKRPPKLFAQKNRLTTEDAEVREINLIEESSSD